MSLPLPSALLVAALLLAGCAATPPTHQALEPVLQAGIGSTEVWLTLPQREIFVQQPAEPKQAGAGDPRLLATPLQAALNGRDVDTQLRAALDQRLVRVTRLATRPARLQKEGGEIVTLQQLQLSRADAVLLLRSSYSLSPDCGTLELGLRALLMLRSAALRQSVGLKPTLPKTLDEGQALYRNTIVFRARLPDAGPDPLDNREQWLVDGAYPLQQALDEGITELSAALAEDLRSKPGARTIGPALGDGYQRTRAPDGSLSIRGLALSGRSVQVEAAAPLPTLAAPTEIQPPEPLPELPPETEPQTEMVEPGLVVNILPEPSPDLAGTENREPLATVAPPPEPEPLATAAAAPGPTPPAPVAAPAPLAELSPPAPPRLSLSPALSSSTAEPPQAATASLPPPAPAAPPAAARVVAPPVPAAAPRYDGRSRDRTPLRLRPTPASAASSTLPAGAGVRVLGRTHNTTGEWLYLQGDSDSGWARPEEVQLNP
ncbi:MAG: hypothetical protein Q8Q73_14630 [Stagnimonas sp.]|nr:hypothetical protein [Stagnimonas sp.]